MIKINFKYHNIIFIILFAISVIFYLKVFIDITWFEDELQGHWLLKRIALSFALSTGYLTQYSYFKIHFSKLSKLSLVFTLIVSLIASLFGGINAFLIFALIIFLLFCSGHNNVLD